MSLITDLFNLDNILQKNIDDKYILCTPGYEWGELSLGIPFIVSEYVLNPKNECMYTPEGVCPIAPTETIPSGYRFELGSKKRSTLIIQKEDSVFNSLVIKEIDNLDINKFTSIKEYVDVFGGISFNIIDNKAAAKNTFDLIKIVSSYKYNTVIFNSFRNITSSMLYGKTIAIFSFFKLNQCVPILNNKRVDGIVLHIKAAQNRGTCLNVQTFGELTLILSNYKDNIFTIDGQYINSSHPISNSMYETIADCMAYNRVDEVKKDRVSGVEAGPTITYNKIDHNIWSTVASVSDSDFMYSWSNSSTT